LRIVRAQLAVTALLESQVPKASSENWLYLRSVEVRKATKESREFQVAVDYQDRKGRPDQEAL